MSHWQICGMFAMRSEIHAIQCYSSPIVALWVEVWGGTITLVHGMKQRKSKTCSHIDNCGLNPNWKE